MSIVSPIRTRIPFPNPKRTATNNGFFIKPSKSTIYLSYEGNKPTSMNLSRQKRPSNQDIHAFNGEEEDHNMLINSKKSPWRGVGLHSNQRRNTCTGWMSKQSNRLVKSHEYPSSTNNGSTVSKEEFLKNLVIPYYGPLELEKDQCNSRTSEWCDPSQSIHSSVVLTKVREIQPTNSGQFQFATSSVGTSMNSPMKVDKSTETEQQVEQVENEASSPDKSTQMYTLCLMLLILLLIFCQFDF